jgi:hypothetical protein
MHGAVQRYVSPHLFYVRRVQDKGLESILVHTIYEYKAQFAMELGEYGVQGRDIISVGCGEGPKRCRSRG